MDSSFVHRGQGHENGKLSSKEQHPVLLLSSRVLPLPWPYLRPAREDDLDQHASWAFIGLDAKPQPNLKMVSREDPFAELKQSSERATFYTALYPPVA